MLVHGWGRYPKISAQLTEPASPDSLLDQLRTCPPTDYTIPRGAGRSYGDSALGPHIMSSRHLDSLLSFDAETGLLHCGAGLTLEQLLQVCIPKGWFPAVVPGTKFISIGGAIAADIHGKNHHGVGSFCNFTDSVTLALADGETVTCSRSDNPELFAATCGGMGLTGVIIDAVIRLEKVSSVFINTRALPSKNLQETLNLLEQHQDSKYAVAWLDCLAQGEQLGRGIVHLGDFDDSGRLKIHNRWGPSVPFNTPAVFLNKHSMRLFNSLYYNLYAGGDSSKVSNESYDEYFFPLDSIGNWNRLYGRKGFLQYQFVVPSEAAAECIGGVLARVAETGKGSFLAVLKNFGEANSNLLSFPRAGMTLTLDFKWEPSLFPLLEELDGMVIAHGGRHYLAKDARLSESVFKAGYPRWEDFLKIKQQVDPENRFASLQSDRIGLTNCYGSPTT